MGKDLEQLKQRISTIKISQKAQHQNIKSALEAIYDILVMNTGKNKPKTSIDIELANQRAEEIKKKYLKEEIE